MVEIGGWLTQITNEDFTESLILNVAKPVSGLLSVNLEQIIKEEHILYRFATTATIKTKTGWLDCKEEFN